MSHFTAEQLVHLGRVTSVAASPDGTWLAVAVQRLDAKTESKYVSDLWRVPLDGSDPVQLTRHRWNDHSPKFMADGSLAFLSNRPTGAGDDDHEERAQLFAMRAWGGEPVCLTDEPLGVLSFEVASDSDVFAIMAPVLLGVAHDEQRETLKERQEKGPSALLYDRMPVRFWDHWLPNHVPHLVVYADGERTDLTPESDGDLFNASYAISPDGSWISLHPTEQGPDRIDDERAEIVDVSTGDRRVLAQRERAWFGSPCISPDGSRIAMVRHVRRDGEYGKDELIVVDVETGEQQLLAEDFDGWLRPQSWTPDGSEILATAAWRTHAPVFAVDAEAGGVRRITAEASGGSHSSIVWVAGDEPHVAGVRSTVLDAPEPFVCPFREGAEPRVIANLSGFSGDFAVAESHLVESTDGTDVQYRVVRPKGESSGVTLIWIHGGPISDWGDIWHWRWNVLCAVDQGHTLVLPNPRGSTGFGQEFVEGIWNNEWGGQCYEDLMAVADDLAARDDVDPDRMVAMGGSFGGYMTNWIGTQTDRFACLITHASIFDVSAFHGVTDLPAWWAFTFGVDPYEERDEFDRHSPLAHVGEWRSPTLIIHGEKDFRVPVGEALALFEALKFHDVDAKLLIYPDENHWILRPKNIVSWYESVFDFIGEYA
jgi:dipeptidyl aminopeptidase/acylaminoacyl peptidase